MRTGASADAYQVVEIVLAVHARTAVGSPERHRCLALIDRLVDADAADADADQRMDTLGEP